MFGVCRLVILHHLLIANDSGVLWRMADCSDAVPEAEAREAGSVSDNMSQIPSRPCLIGRKAWIHFESDNKVFNTDDKHLQSLLLNFSSNGCCLHGAALRVKSICWKPIELRMMISASWLSNSGICERPTESFAMFASKAFVRAVPADNGAPNRCRPD